MSEEQIIDDANEIAADDRLKELQKQLILRCRDRAIETELIDRDDGSAFVVAKMPNGREKRPVTFLSADVIESALQLCFEKYVFIGDYLAIANYEENSIEAGIRPIGGIPRGNLPKMLWVSDDESGAANPLILTKGEVEGGATLEISDASAAFKVLARSPYVRNGTASIKIAGITISQHNKTLEILRRLTDSLFFQIEMNLGVTLSLIRDRRLARRPGRSRPESGSKIEFPKVEFDESPMSLYWYARSATGMPLLQFLAFYQVIEYYYPTYTQEEARRRIRTLLKDPSFRSDRDSDIGKVLTVISGVGRGFGDERSQLRATLNACLDPDDLRLFFEENEERVAFFSAKQKGLSDHKLPIATKDADLRNPVADLIYDIRCKIVHTKGESSAGDVELLLPFSKEAELLFYDIELMQYVARKVLIAASVPITF